MNWADPFSHGSSKIQRFLLSEALLQHVQKLFVMHNASEFLDQNSVMLFK